MGRDQGRRVRAYRRVSVVVVLTVAATIAGAVPAPASSAGDWTTYLGSLGRRSYNRSESTITAASAPNLKQQWTASSPGNVVFSQPIVTNGLVYWGSFDGYEHATTTSGTAAWHQFIGVTTAGPGCNPSSAGVASTPTVHNMTIGTSTSVLFVGGGDAQVYALDALTGAILWTTRLGSSPDTFLWSSPAVYQGSVYIGVASFGDCPLVQGQLVQLDARTGEVQHTFDTVPPGCIGGGVWSSPTIDTDAGTIYFDTGNGGTCSTSEPLGQSVVEVRAADLSLVGSWAVPVAQQLKDGDFGATTTLFLYKSGGQTHKMVGVVNKNGIYYAFGRDELTAGPVWQQRISHGGGGPQNGSGDISPSAWGANMLYVAGGTATVSGASCLGVITALKPATGAPLWQDCLPDGPVLGAVAAVPGVVTVGEGKHIVLLSAKTGAVLLSYATAAPVWGAATIADGVLYQGDLGGTLYALAP